MDITFYLICKDVAGEVVDLFGNTTGNPVITRGLLPTLAIRPLKDDGTPYTVAELNYASWYCAMCGDWDVATVPELLETAGVTVVTVQIEVDGSMVDYAEIRIPLTDTNTVELIAKLANSTSVDLGVELAGIAAGESIPGFISQFDMTVRARRYLPGTGQPENVPDDDYTASQIDALFEACEPRIVSQPVDFTIAQPNIIYTVPVGKLFKPDFGKSITKELDTYGAGLKSQWRAGLVNLMPVAISNMEAQYAFDDVELAPEQYFPAGTQIIFEVVDPSTSLIQTGSAQIKGDLIDA